MMNLFDQLVLLATGLVAIYAIWMLMGRQKNVATKHFANIYFMISFAVLLVSGLLLIFLGWEILGLLGHGSGTSKLVAVVATLIPFSLATGLVSRFYPQHEKVYLATMLTGIVLIAISRFADMGTFARIIYPVFHSIAGLTIFFIPIMMVKNGVMSKCFYWVTVGWNAHRSGWNCVGIPHRGQTIIVLLPRICTYDPGTTPFPYSFFVPLGSHAW